MGQHADRNAQFERIAALKQECLDAGLPVISIDTKKKELLGNFIREGVINADQPVLPNAHDFGSQNDGKLTSHGIYDVGQKRGQFHLNTSHDTCELSCESIELRWRDVGQRDYPGTRKLLVLCDGGGSTRDGVSV